MYRCMRRVQTLPNDRAEISRSLVKTTGHKRTGRLTASAQECLKMAGDVVGNTNGNTDRWDQRQTKRERRTTSLAEWGTQSLTMYKFKWSISTGL